MGRKITNLEGFPASPMLREKIGSSLTGTVVSTRIAKTQYGDKPVYTVKLVDADCDFLRDGLPYEPAAGELVEIMPPSVLAKHLAQVQPGETFKTVYQGLGKKGKGNPPHLFITEVL